MKPIQIDPRDRFDPRRAFQPRPKPPARPDVSPARPDVSPARPDVSPARQDAAPRRKRRSRFLALLKWGGVLMVWGMLLLGGYLAWIATSLPDTSALGGGNRHPSVTLRAIDGSLIATYGDLYGEPLHLADLPKALPEAVIATEDRRFYHHFGIDPIGVMRAILVDLRSRQMVQGGSTLTQQLAKNLFLTPDRTLKRKLQEMMLAVWLEQHFSKNQILEIYLNRVYFGAGAYGVDAASRRYFGKSARQLNVYESALIAGLLKGPSRYSPAGNPARAEGRARQVLANMVETGVMTPAAAANAARQGAAILAAVPVPQPGMRYFADWVQDQAVEAGYYGDLVVLTTLDPKMQKAAEAALEQALSHDGPKAAASQAALVAMTPGGAIRAMVGGRDYQASQFNRVTQAERQPGSAFKPFVYLAALENGVQMTDRFTDAPLRIGNWQPHNFEPGYRGEISLGDALAESINTVAAQLAQHAGLSKVIDVAHRLGITSDLDPDPSLALGTGEVNLLDLTTAYCAFASGGYRALPYGVVEIQDSSGKTLFRRQGSGPDRVIQPAYANDMNQLLAGVLTHGTGRAAQIGRPAAGKTGTTWDFHDALFVGYTADLVAGVWFGNDDNSPMNHVTGGSLPARAWHRFMLASLQDVPAHPLPVAIPDPVPEMATAPESTPAGPAAPPGYNAAMDPIDAPR